MKRPKGWDQPFPVGRFWRCALVVFFNYGVDTGTVWKSAPFHEPILWRHVSWERESPDREIKEQSRWGWLFYRRVKTGKVFYRPMNRVVHAHIRSIMPENPRPDDPVFLGGGTRPNRRFRQLCDLAEIKPKLDAETGKATHWLLKDLRKTCATYYDEHLGIVNRNPRSLRGWRNLSPLRAPRSAGIQGDHDDPTTVRVWRTCERIRWRVSVLSDALRGRFVNEVDVTWARKQATRGRV
jgi:hypothetical protein